MPPRSDYISLGKLPALCRLVADDMDIPADVRASILDSLVYWWEESTEPAVLEALKELFLLLPSSSAAPIVAEKLIRLVDVADQSLIKRTFDLLPHFSSTTEIGVALLASTLTTRRGPARWRTATALAELGIEDDSILGYLLGEAPAHIGIERHAARAANAFDLVKYQKLYKASSRSGATDFEKGQALEDLAEYIFLCIPGMNTIARNLRTLTEEIDLAFSNKGDGFWRDVGNPFIVECRNLAKTVDAKAVRDFKGKLQAKGLRSGFMVTTNRLTRPAEIEIRQALSEGRVIISLHGSHLAALAQGEELGKLLESRFYKCRLL